MFDEMLSSLKIDCQETIPILFILISYQDKFVRHKHSRNMLNCPICLSTIKVDKAKMLEKGAICIMIKYQGDFLK